MTYPLMLTVEHEDGEWSDTNELQPPYGFAVIKLNGREIGRTELSYSRSATDRDALEGAAADWLASAVDSKQNGA